ncbi:unnamed protein product [Prorocentrum cordatum]|uniref:Uncharacterized protein n=1 Tax=Prorocentrum cordatum TaxID=2364126 RepID=A0ABN9RX65_9DINO|nr:unnamed protein product [Polarella glacialis]
MRYCPRQIASALTGVASSSCITVRRAAGSRPTTTWAVAGAPTASPSPQLLQLGRRWRPRRERWRRQRATEPCRRRCKPGSPLPRPRAKGRPPPPEEALRKGVGAVKDAGLKREQAIAGLQRCPANLDSASGPRTHQALAAKCGVCGVLPIACDKDDQVLFGIQWDESFFSTSWRPSPRGPTRSPVSRPT